MAKRIDRTGEFRTAFEKNRQIILRTQKICAICGQEVDRRYKYPHPLSPSIDHIIPLAKGGHPSDLSNLQLAHRWCNRWKADKLIGTKIDIVNEDQEINNFDLPLHFDWINYKA